MMTKDQAKAAVQAALRGRKLTKRMTQVELLLFCQEMYKELEFRSKSDRLQDIRAWAEEWQGRQFR